MKRWLNEHKCITAILSITFLLIVPFIINCLFKLRAPFELFAAEWEAGDVLSFYGALLASVATIIGVYLSIIYAQKNYREDERNRIKPYLALTHLRSKSNANFFNTTHTKPDQESVPKTLFNPLKYEEFKIKKVFVDIAPTGILFKTSLTDEQQKILEQAGFVWDSAKNNYALVSKHYISLPFEIENIGNGAAIDFIIAFYKKGGHRRGIRIYTVKQNSSIYLHIFSECKVEDTYGDYILELQYRDIIGTTYSQKYPICFELNCGSLETRVDFAGNQEIIEEKESVQA